MTEREALPAADWPALLQWAQREEYPEGTLLPGAGESPDHFYVILEGTIGEHSGPEAPNGITDAKLGPGELAGALAFFSGNRAGSDLRCISHCELARVSRPTFDTLLVENPALWRKLEEIGLAHMRRTQLAGHLDRLFGPFGAIMPHILRDLEADMQWLTLSSGESLFAQGDTGDAAYVLMTGRLEMATALADGREIINGTVVPGETVGEVALLTGQRQAHTVFAARDSELVRLSPHSFDLMLQRNTRAIHNVSRILGERLAQGPITRDRSVMPIRCISLIPASPDLDLKDLATGFERCMGSHGSTCQLASDTVDRELGSPGIAQANGGDAAGLRLGQWLCEQEDHWRYLLYRGDSHWSPWTARCARQTDQVVVVADADSQCDLRDLAARFSGPRQRWSLVLLHPENLQRPRDSARWLRQSTAEHIYHIRRGNHSDLERLVRILTGNAVSLVLGGGGARGFAHLGVLRAMEELGIPVDMIGGTSMGAPIAGFVAQGVSCDEICSRARRAYRNLIDFTLPMVSLIAGERISSAIRRETGDWDIEDYWLPFFCVATNLTTGQPVVHSRGNSWRAIRSSVSIPGVLPPLPVDGALMVDGAVLNNLPVDVMREFNPYGKVIAVDVTPPRGPTARSDYGAGLSGWKHLMASLLPWRQAPAVPGIASTILQATMAGSALKRQQDLEQKLADVYLNINVESVGLLEFDAQDEAAQLGYEGAIGPLRSWLEAQR